MEDLIIYVVLDEDNETDTVTTDLEKALEEFEWYRDEKKNAFFEVWKNNICIFYASWKTCYKYTLPGRGESFREMVLKRIEG